MDKEIIIDGVDVSGCKYYKHNDENSGWSSCISKDEEHIHAVNPLCCEKEDCLFKQLARKTQECNELKIENEELNNRIAEVTYRATGGRLSYSNYTLDAIEQAFNDQLEILSDQKVEEEIKELNQKLYLVQNEVHVKTEYIQEQREEIKQLEQECERSLKRISDLEERIINHSNKIEEYCSRLANKDKECKELERKLEIAKEALQYYAELYIDTDICDDQFFGYDAQQALQNMEEVSNE